MTHVGAIAAWVGPTLVVAVVARVTSGGIEAPLFVLAVLTAPLLALLAEPSPHGAPCAFTLPIGLVMAICVLGAGFHVVTDFAQVLGFDTRTTLRSAAALVVVATVWPGRDRVATGALALGAGALLIAVIGLGVATGMPPWTAWNRVASRGAFELSPRSAWTREGVHVVAPLTLTFTEPHRITVATAGLYRVTERDRAAVVVREWRLAAGDSLRLRPGDVLAVPAGARVRFEPGRRLPGAPASGVAWADRSGVPALRLLADWLGLAITLAGGALAVVRPVASLSRGAALLGPATVLGVVLAATCWGVYAVDAAPELSIGASPVTSLARLAPAVAAEPWAARLLVAVVVALIALLVAAAAALHQRLVDLADLQTGPPTAPIRRGIVRSALWIALVGAAAAGSAWVADGWWLFVQGAGLAASTVLGPLLATGHGAGVRRARIAGALAGAAVFVGLAAAAHPLGWLTVDVTSAVARYPALIAAPAAWLVASVVRTASAGRGELVAAARRH